MLTLCYYNIVNTNSKKYLFHNISLTYHVHLAKQGLLYLTSSAKVDEI